MADHWPKAGALIAERVADPDSPDWMRGFAVAVTLPRQRRFSPESCAAWDERVNRRLAYGAHMNLVVAPICGAAETSVAEWISTVGQVVGALATLAAVIVALWIAGRDTRRLEGERADRDKAQARLVAITAVGSGGAGIVITNHSDRPILHPQIEDVTVNGSLGLTWRVNPKVPNAGRPRDVLSPGEPFEVPVEFVDEGGTVTRLDQGQCTVTIIFTDAAGLRWRRVGNSEPTRIDGA